MTHRDSASAVAFVTGHEDPTKDGSALDWEALARFPGTLVFYMGIKNLPLIAERLVAAGPPRLGAGGRGGARHAGGTADGRRHAGRHRRAGGGRGVRPPAITVVGPVAELHETLAWLERRPLHGEVVAVTRARAQASELAARLRGSGRGGGGDAGDPDRAALGRAAPSPPRPLCFTSANGVHLFFDALSGDARSLAGARVAAIGPGTAAALREHGIEADVVAGALGRRRAAGSSG